MAGRAALLPILLEQELLASAVAVSQFSLSLQVTFRNEWLTSLALPRYGQGHPFTVANSPGAGETHLEFVIKVWDGTTRHLARAIERREQPSVRTPVSVEGPYAYRPQVEDFDRVLLFGGGSGITFVSSVLGDLVRRGRAGSAVKEVRFV